MVWDLEPDVIGLDRFKPWEKVEKEKLREKPRLEFVDDATSGSLTPLEDMEGKKLHEAWEPREPREPSPRRLGQEKNLRALVRECCMTLRRPAAEADRFVAQLQTEWLETPKQLLSLNAEGWARLALPMGLESELQRRLGVDRLDPPSTARPRPREARDGRNRWAPTVPSPAKPKTGQRQPVQDRVSHEGLRQALKGQCGDAWASHLLSALGLQRRDTVDANSLQSALRVLGVAVFSTAQVQSAVRAAAKGAEFRGPPSADAVVAAIHGPLRGSRAQVVDDAFFDLGGDIRGSLPLQTLRKRIAALELPAVKAGRASADEALRDFMRRWSSKKDIDRESFSAAHIVVAALYRGDDMGFGRLIRRIWRLPQASEQDTGGKPVRPSPVPPEAVEDLRRDPPGRRPGTPGGAQRGARDRMAAIAESIQCSDGASSLLERIRLALRGRGPGAVQLLCQRFQLADRGQGVIQAKDLRHGLGQVGVGASEEDVVELLRSMDVDGRGAVDLDDWLRVLRGPLTPMRAAVVREAFHSLSDRDGLADLRTLRARFKASKHPDVEAGRKSQKEVIFEFMSQLGSHGEVRISLADFARYYETISAGIQDDQYFGHVVRSVWGMPMSAGNNMARNAHRNYEGHITSTEGGLCGL
mmetsp:Transcript_8632/g.20508  ORF Transcript_8632/g.20508 Transcript_8632/m.20508 type:complete len:642 (+) Transcript_8632:42-1967(+)